MQNYPKSVAYVKKNLVPHIFCKRCGAGVLKSDVKGYSFLCVHCDENLYKSEVYKDKKQVVTESDIKDMSLLVNQELGLDEPYEELANTPLYEYMRRQGIGDFTEDSKEEDIQYFEWYMEEAKKLHNLVGAVGRTDVYELASYIKNLQQKAGENTEWFNKFLKRKEDN